MNLKTIFLLSLGIILTCLLSCSKGKGELVDNYVVLVSFDAFRWDFTDLYDTPNFDKLAKDGVKAEYMKASFPTKTFPNHYTIATGLYPDHHGIINNTFFVPDLDKLFRIGNREMVMNPDAYFGEPIWVTAEKQGMLTASYFWVGTEAAIQGYHPTYWKAYEQDVPFASRIDTVIRWLSLPEKSRPRFVTLYFHEPDGVGHEYGPEHPQTGREIERLDRLLGSLREKLGNLDIGEKVNLIVVSDHGMASITPDKYVNLSDILKPDWILSVYGGNPIYLVDGADNYEDSVVNAINDVIGVSAWTAEDIPPHLHYGTSERFPGILIAADSGWSIGTGSEASSYTGGAHGYDCNNSDMYTIFYADGPAFKDGISVPPFSNVEVYGIVAHILGIDPVETDGDLSRVSGIFSGN